LQVFPVRWIKDRRVAYNRGHFARGWGVKQCKECSVGEDDAYLHKCPICHKMICDEHKFMRSGRIFCSDFCAAYFFHEGDDDD
jgi:hypothetical protein